MARDRGGVAPAVACRVLGPLELAVGDVPVELGGAQRRAVMAMLVAAGGSSVSEAALVEGLWGDEASASARNTIQSHVSRLRAAMARAGLQQPREVLQRTPGGYRLALTPGQVDTDLVEALAARARGCRRDDPAAAAALLSDALALWRGLPFEEFEELPGWAHSELAGAQAGLVRTRSVVSEELLDARLAAGDHVTALPELERMATADPLREPIHRMLALALYRGDRPSDALAVLRRLRQQLLEEAGLDPSQETVALEQAILRNAPELSPVVPTPPAATPSRPHTWLRPVTSMHGRSEDMGVLLGFLERGGLVTLTGPGGVGKTRLAMEAVSRLDASAAHTLPVVVLELAALHRGDAMVPLLARLLGVQAPPHESLDDVVVEYLATQRMLIVADNCEHLLADTAALVARLVATAPAVTVLATSRERLAVAGEQVMPLGPLPVAPPRRATPDRAGDPAPGDRVERDATPGPDERDADAVSMSPATELFVARATRARPGFVLTDRDRLLVEDLCRHLDGLPLAIELAASQLGTFGLADLHDHLPERLDLLGRGRHLSLRDVIDRSWELLDDHERDMYERLAVFDGGFTLEAAIAVAARAGGPALAARTLARLVDASLVAVADDGHGRMRYRLLETLRIHGRERAEVRGTHRETVRRHVAWVVAFTELAEHELDGPAEAVWVDRIEVEFDNVRTAWHAAHRHDDLTSAARITVALATYAQMQGQVELLAMATHLVQHPDLPKHPLGAAVHGAAAQAHNRQGDLAAAAMVVDAGMALSAGRDTDGRDEPADRGWWLEVAASVSALYRGEHADSERLSREALARAGAWPLWRALILGDIALARSYAGDRDGAQAVVADCTGAAAVSGAPTARAWAHFVAGEVALPTDPARAVVELEAAIELARSVRATFVEGVAMVSLLSAAIRAQDHARAVATVPHVIGHWRRLGGMWVHQWTTLRVVAGLLAALGVDESAVILLAAATAADDAPTVSGTDAVQATELEARLRRRLGEAAHLRCRAQGAAMSGPDAVAHALDVAVPRAAVAAGTRHPH